MYIGEAYRTVVTTVLMKIKTLEYQCKMKWAMAIVYNTILCITLSEG